MSSGQFDLKDFLPSTIFSGENRSSLPLSVKESGEYLDLAYVTRVMSPKGEGKREFADTIIRYIGRNNETFEALGLLQAEMGKTQNGCVTFCNHEYQIMRKVITWFERELRLSFKNWRWYIKVNLKRPEDEVYRRKIEEKVISHWLQKAKIDPEMRYPTTVSYIRDTKNSTLGASDYGTLVIDYKNNIFSQVIKSFLSKVTQKIAEFQVDEIRKFMRGIIAGEGCVEIDVPSKKFRIKITASKSEERFLYMSCLNKLGISSIEYAYNKDVCVSKKENLLKLLEQKLLCLSPQKYNKFLNLFKNYQHFPAYDAWKRQQDVPHNKVPPDVVNRILEIHHQNPSWPAWKIAEKVGVSAIKVQRVLKEHNLGKRIFKTPGAKRREIAEFTKAHPGVTFTALAVHFNVHESVVRRAVHAFHVERGNLARCHTPQEKIRQILDLYEKNPTIKVSEVVRLVGVSDSVVSRVRREYGLHELGYKHLIGCNNKQFLARDGPSERLFLSAALQRQSLYINE